MRYHALYANVETGQTDWSFPVNAIPQTRPLTAKQIQNNAGGFVFGLDDWKRLDRFLILGSDSSTYYEKAGELTRANAKCVERCYMLSALRTVARIVEISESGRAPKNDAAIFALALGAASPDVETRKLALGSLSKVCRTSTHLFAFVKVVRGLGRGWGRTLKSAVAKWYDDKPVGAVAYQAIKYRSREGYSHKRLLQLAHPSGGQVRATANCRGAVYDGERVALYRWICGKGIAEDGVEVARNTPIIVQAHLAAMAATDVDTWVKGIKWHNLPWEALPTEAAKEPEVWQAMLRTMGLTALIRNLGNMSRIGAIEPFDEKVIVERLKDAEDIRKARLHPFNILQAMAVYRSGHGFRGKGTWVVSQPIVAALEWAFYESFQNVVPTGKRTLIGLDVSGSMSSPFNDSALTVAEAAAAMAMVTIRTELWHKVMGFAGTFRDLGISASDSLSDVLFKTTRQNFGRTDCALPMLYAAGNNLQVDTFIIYTDNETWCGHVHPMEALRRYRSMMGINAKLIVVGMTSTGFSIADPQDGGALDVVGFDSSAPAVMADFARG